MTLKEWKIANPTVRVIKKRGMQIVFSEDPRLTRLLDWAVHVQSEGRTYLVKKELWND